MNQYKVALLLGFVIMLLSACAPLALEEIVVTEESKIEVDVTDTADASPTGTENPDQHMQNAECDDPFNGRSPQFSTRFWEGRTNFCLHSVGYDEFFSGGPPPDGIPAIDEPVFESVELADEWLEDNWPVMFFAWNGEARAYPLAILIWHEIVNDEVGGEPVSLTFCPLCNATVAFRRTQPDGQVLDFGTTGNLRFSDLVMYDRQTYSWWQQFTGEAIVGELTGTMLELLPSQIIAWSDFKEAHPDSKVLSRDTGHNRTYGSNPYAGYDTINSSPFFPIPDPGLINDRLVPMERVVAIEIEQENVAYPFGALEQVGVVNDEVANVPLVVFWEEGTVSTFGNFGPETGSTGVFHRRLEDQVMDFWFEDGDIVDQQTGSQWNILGQAIAGPLEGMQLERIVSAEHFWFAWIAFKPETSVWEPG